MAEVDFTNAKIEPVSNLGGGLYNPTAAANVSLASTNYLCDSSLNNIASLTRTQLINQQKQLMFLYQGTFTASGTEFYIYGVSGSTRVGAWRIYNISFSSGDTFIFQINADLVCN